MYELEIYDKAYTNESRLIFSRKLSPREVLQAVNKWNFYEWNGENKSRLCDYTSPLTQNSEYYKDFDSDIHTDSFSAKVSYFGYVSLYRVEFDDYLLGEL